MRATTSRLTTVALASALAAASTAGLAGNAAAHQPRSGPAHLRVSRAQPQTARAANGCTPRGVLSHMGLAQRVGQLFVMGVDTAHPTAYQKRMIRRHHIGGVVLMGHSNNGTIATWRTVQTLKQQARSHGVGLWVAVDQEGGYVQVLHGPGFSEMPTALHQGSWRNGVLRAHAHKWGLQLYAAGVNLNLAPVMDTVPKSLGRRNKPIGYYYREYGHKPGVVAVKGVAVRRGMHAAGVQTSAKHFPGLGRVLRNTDTSYGVHDDVTTRHDRYLQPFQAAVNSRIPVVMVSSVRYNKIDKRWLAPFTPVILRSMLRYDLGFDGVIMSDDLGAAKAVSRVPVGNRATRFLRSGGNVVLTVKASTIPAMTQALKQRARNVQAFRHKVNAAALQVLQAKARMTMLPCQHTRARTTDRGLPAGTANFQPFGEHIYLCDRVADGKRAVVHVHTSKGVSTKRHNARGTGTCTDEDFAIPERGWIKWRVCVQHGAHGREQHCSRVHRASARG